MEPEVVGKREVNLEKLAEIQEAIVEMVAQAEREKAYGTRGIEFQVQGGVIQRITTQQINHVR